MNRMVMIIMFLSMPPTSSMSDTTACGRRRRLKGDVETLGATQVPSKAPVGHLEAAGGNLLLMTCFSTNRLQKDLTDHFLGPIVEGHLQLGLQKLPAFYLLRRKSLNKIREEKSPTDLVSGKTLGWELSLVFISLKLTALHCSSVVI